MVTRRNRSLTVLMTADAVGGVWQYAMSICAALPEMRFILAVMGPAPDAARRQVVAGLPNVMLEHGDFRLEWMAGGAADLPASRRWLAGLALRHRADLLHVNGYAHAVNEAGLPVVVVAHSDVCSWWRAVHHDPAPREWDLYCRALMAGLRAADRVVAPTAAVLDDLARQYQFDTRGASVIANGTDIGAFAPGEKRPVVMAAGRLWDAAKNLALLDEIAADLQWPVEIAGDAQHPERGIAAFRHARLLGVLQREEMAARLAAASIFAAPARYEPFGLGILEAAASGCALVLGDIASLRELWTGAAVFVAPGDREGWRDALSRLTAGGERRQELADAARQRAMLFTRQRMAAAYAALYQDLVGPRASRPRRGRHACAPSRAA
jgi:glycosyltransferase involved in cell wall biosynthesis